MDSIVPKKTRLKKKIIRIFLVTVLLAVLTGGILYSIYLNERIVVEKDLLTFYTVEYQDFSQYIQTSGQLVASQVINIYTPVAGVLSDFFVHTGDFVTQGERLCILENSQLKNEKYIVEQQIEKLIYQIKKENLNIQHKQETFRIDSLVLKNNIAEKLRTYQDNVKLMEINSVSFNTLEKSKSDWEYLKSKEISLEKTYLIEISKIETDIDILQADLNILTLNQMKIEAAIADLVITTPITGQIIELLAQKGERVLKDQPLAIVSNSKDIKISTAIDEYYLRKIKLGMAAVATIQGKDYQVVISHINPEVINHEFFVECVFTDIDPSDFVIGQSVTIEIELLNLNNSVVLKNGSFLDETNGNWIYLVSPDQSQAVKQEIILGNSNPEYHSVVSGLSPGDTVIISNYRHFRGKEKIILK